MTFLFIFTLLINFSLNTLHHKNDKIIHQDKEPVHYNLKDYILNDYELFERKKSISLIKCLEQLNKDIYPNFELTTYLEDPNKKNLVYVFIENIKTKIIKHYTINLKFKFTYSHLLSELYKTNDTKNEIFDYVLLYSIDLVEKILILINNKNIISDQMFCYYQQIMKNTFTNLQIINNYNINLPKCYLKIKNLLKQNDIYDLNNLNEYTKICDTILSKKFKIDNIIIINKEKFKYLEQKYIFYKIKIFRELYLLDNIKIKNVIQLLEIYSKNLQRFFYRHNFDSDHLLYIFNKELIEVNDKIFKFTFILCYLNSQEYKSYPSSFSKSKLIIFCWFFNIFRIKNFDEWKENLLMLICVHKKVSFVELKLFSLVYLDNGVNKFNNFIENLVVEIYFHVADIHPLLPIGPYLVVRNFNFCDHVLIKMVLQAIKVSCRAFYYF